MLETVNKVYFKQSDYDSLEDMFEAIFFQELTLVRSNYMCTTYKSPTNNNIYVLEFASMDPLLNQERLLPCWITAIEANALANMRKEYYRNNFGDIINDSLKLDIDVKDDHDDDNNGGNGFDA